jgi:hypothetical protein
MASDDAPKSLANAPLEEIELAVIRALISDPVERLWFKDREGRFLLLSDAVVRRMGEGLTLKDIIGKTDFDAYGEGVVTDDSNARSAQADEERIIATGEPIRDKLERDSFEGRVNFWASTTKMPLRNERGEIIGTWGYSSDASAQAYALMALEDSRESIAHGLEAIVEVIDGFSQLSEQTKSVSELLKKVSEGELREVSNVSTIIDDVASRTKLLALNAAIEAARAGDYGRGFAIVADEVGRLAAEATEQTKRIASTIEKIEAEMREVSEAAEEAFDRAARGAMRAGQGREALEKLTSLLEARSEERQVAQD